MRVAIATCSAIPPDLQPDRLLVEALERREVAVAVVPWDDPSASWQDHDRVVIRSTWDYTRRRDRFLAWADAIGGRLDNPLTMVRWNSDKRYLADLAAAGVAVVPTTYLAPGEPLPSFDGEVVVKPAVSAGAIDTGRFSDRTRSEAEALVARIHGRGGVAMVQPYLASVDESGETAVVCIDGEVSHALHKGQVLRPDEVAPVREGDGVGAAEVMYDPELVRAASADDAEVAFARRVIDAVTARFGAPPLYARVDMVRGPDGSPVLMELEAVEPDLYLDEAPAAAERLAAAIVRRVGPAGGQRLP